MPALCCPTCGRRLPATKAPAVLDPSQLSDTDVFAYYKRVAPIADCTFWATHCGHPEIRQKFVALLARLEAQGGKHTPATRAEYVALQDEWRRATNTYRPVTRGLGMWTQYAQDATGQYYARQKDGTYTPCTMYEIHTPCVIHALPADARLTDHHPPANAFDAQGRYIGGRDDEQDDPRGGE
jgi:hypothetical protein